MAKIKSARWAKTLYGPERYKAYYGGRGAGKSHEIAQALVIQGAQKPLRILCCREIQLSIKDSVKLLLDDKIKKSGLEGFYKSTQTEIVGANGTYFAFAGLRTNPDSVKSKEGFDIAWVEEASTVSQRSLGMLIPTMRKEGSQLIFSWNPEFPTDPVDNMFRGGEAPPNSVVMQINGDDNPWFPEALAEERAWDRSRDPDKAHHVWDGGYVTNSETRIFKNWKVEEFEAPEDTIFRFGADFGFSVDPSTLVRFFVDDEARKIYIDYEAYQVGCEIDHLPALYDTVPESRKWKITADNARPETISYLKRQNFRIVGARKGKNSIEDGIEFIKSYDVIIHPRCKHTQTEFMRYSYKRDKRTDEILPVIEDDNNHIIDALRYGCEDLRLASGVEIYIV